MCPSGTSCAVVNIAGEPTTFCVTPEQSMSCDGADDGERCEITGLPGTCHEEVCLPDRCGNLLVDHDEACDDGNTVDKDGCASTCASNETCGNRVVDLLLGEGCDAGDDLAHDGCSSTCEVEQPTWEPVANARPDARTLAAIAYDSARRRVVMFGGQAGSFTLGDTAEWDGRRWSRPTELTTPSIRSGHAIAYDSHRHQLVMFGGGTSETWERAADGVWRLRSSAVHPPATFGATMVYDASRRRVVLFGGNDDVTWTWDGSTWTALAAPMPRPSVRFRPAMAYDPKRGVVVLFGGATFGGPGGGNDLWELDGDVWTERRPATTLSARTLPAMAYDPVTEQVLLVGGPVKETWGWNGQVWTRLADAIAIAPDTGISSHAMTTDFARGRVVLLGPHGDVQEWDGTAWTLADLLPSPAQALSARCFHAGAIDSLRREVVVFGGTLNDAAITTFGDTWIWNGTWRRSVVTLAPSARFGASMSFDAVRGEVVLFGGCNSNLQPLGDTWVWRDQRWIQLAPTRSPPPRCYHASVFDEARAQVVMFGGQGTAGPRADTWTWDGTTWTDASPVISPRERTGMAMGYDPIRARTVLFSGGDNRNTVFEDTWTWDGASWTEVVTSVAPSMRNFTPLAWDAARQRLVMFAGNAQNVVIADVWEWEGTRWTLIPTQRAPTPRSSHLLVPAIDGAGILVIGGYSYNTPPSNRPLDDMWRLTWDARGVQDACTDFDTDGDSSIGCADPDCWSSCTPVCPPSTSCNPAAPRCGDGVCNTSLESCYLCSADCGVCTPRCGDTACDPTETITSCPGVKLPRFGGRFGSNVHAASA